MDESRSTGLSGWEILNSEVADNAQERERDHEIRATFPEDGSLQSSLESDLGHSHTVPNFPDFNNFALYDGLPVFPFSTHGSGPPVEPNDWPLGTSYSFNNRDYGQNPKPMFSVNTPLKELPSSSSFPPMPSDSQPSANWYSNPAYEMTESLLPHSEQLHAQQVQIPPGQLPQEYACVSSDRSEQSLGNGSGIDAGRVDGFFAWP